MTNHQDAADEKGKCKLIWAAHKQKHTMCICVTLICIRLHEWSRVNMRRGYADIFKNTKHRTQNTKYKIQKPKIRYTKTQTNNMHLLCDTGLASACMSAGANMFKCIELMLGHRDPI